MKKIIVLVFITILLVSCTSHNYTVNESIEPFVTHYGIYDDMTEKVVDTDTQQYLFTTYYWNTNYITFISNTDKTNAIVYSIKMKKL